MLIDSNIYYSEKFNIENILDYMKNNNISKGIVSSLFCENSYQNVEKKFKRSQIEINNDLLQAICNEDNLYMKFYISRRFEEFTNEVSDYICKHKEKIKGIRFNAFDSQIHINHGKLLKYLDFCGEMNIPITVYTSKEQMSAIKLLYEVSRKFPKVKFLAEFMGKDTMHIKESELIKGVPNLYGDTSGIKFNEFKNIYNNCLKTKILFGTSMPNYEQDFYKEYFDNSENINEIFNLNIKEFFNI